MENLNGHEAGNGGHSQGDTYGNSPSLDPTVPSKGYCLLAGESPAMAKARSHVAWMAGDGGNAGF